MALWGWRLSPDGHRIKSSSAGSDQKLFMLLSPQMGAKLGETPPMSIVTQRYLWSSGRKQGLGCQSSFSSGAASVQAGPWERDRSSPVPSLSLLQSSAAEAQEVHYNI